MRQASVEQRNINRHYCRNSSDLMLLSGLLKGRPAFANNSVQCEATLLRGISPNPSF